MGVSLALGGLGFLGGELQNIGSAQQAKQQMAFQERMSSTSYQRAVADMKAAGLNPALAYQQGGASSPGGAQAPVQDVVSKGVSSAIQAKSVQADVEQRQQQARLTSAQADMYKVEAMARLSEISARTKGLFASAAYTGAQQDALEKQTPYNVMQAYSRAMLTDMDVQKARELFPFLGPQAAAQLGLTRQQIGTSAASAESARASAAQSRQNTELMRQTMGLRALDVPESLAKSKYWSSQFGQNIAPYMSGAGNVIDLLRKLEIFAGGY